MLLLSKKTFVNVILFSLLLIQTSGTIKTLDTTLAGGNAQHGNMFDLCAKTYLEITSFDINCKSIGIHEVEIYVATKINQSHVTIENSPDNWTLIHRTVPMCKSEGTLTVLSSFSIDTIHPIINNGDCRGFYVTLTSGTTSLSYTSGTSVGNIFASNTELDFKEGIAISYPFGSTNSPRIWNGRIHYTTDTRSPTIQSVSPTTANPTMTTFTPTSTPTPVIYLCETSPYPTWCYDINLHPRGSATTTTVNITDINRNSDTYFNVVFTPRGQSCINPSITFEYEQIDISGSSEYIDVFSNEDVIIQRCQGNGGADSQCYVWWTCLLDYNLGIPQINVNTPYQITLMTSSETDALCSFHTLATNAKLHFSCKGTASPTNEPTNDPTMEPTLPTESPTTNEPTIVSENPTAAPTLPTIVPSISPTLAPTTEISLCGINPYPTWCYHIDVYPGNAITTTTVNISDIDRGSHIYFNIILTPRGRLCHNPFITFEYEQIDIALSTEYVDVINNDGTTIQRCQGNGGVDSQCNVWWTCLLDYNLGITQINMNESYQIQLMATSENDALCHHLVLNAKLHVTCDGSVSPTVNPTLNPTIEPTIQTLAPTTNEPTQTTDNPSQYPTMEPTVPTFQPTLPTFNPTMTTFTPTSAPTPAIYLCETSPYPTWCYNINLYPRGSATTTTVNITDIDRNAHTYFNIVFTPRDQSCINPAITFEYEQIDISGSNEYIDVFSNEDVIIQRCQGNIGADSQCNVWWTCLLDYNLGIHQINVNTPYQIKLMTSVDTDALCSSFHLFATNAKLHFSCKGTDSPTIDPTYNPSQTPSAQTLMPTTSEPTAPTQNPTIYPTVAPTVITFNPTSSPIDISYSLCDLSPYPKWCYYVGLHPGDTLTETTVNITDIDRNSVIYFNIIFTPRGESCINPSISFEYEQIDISSSTEYIDVINNNGTIIKRCQGNGGSDTQCNVWWTCLLNYDLNITQININQPYQIQLITPSGNDALCSHKWTINSKLTFTCEAITENPTHTPTNIPTINPTHIPTITTFNPTTNPTSEPTIPTFEPTINPTVPTDEPTIVPTFQPTFEPSIPTLNPSYPTIQPTNPTFEPTNIPTFEPTNIPTFQPTLKPILLTTTDKSNDDSQGNSSSHFSTSFEKSILIILIIFILLLCICAGVYYIMFTKTNIEKEEQIKQMQTQIELITIKKASKGAHDSYVALDEVIDHDDTYENKNNLELTMIETGPSWMSKKMKFWDNKEIIDWVKCMNLDPKMNEKIFNIIEMNGCIGQDIIELKSVSDVGESFGIIDNIILCKRILREIKSFKPNIKGGINKFCIKLLSKNKHLTLDNEVTKNTKISKVKRMYKIQYEIDIGINHIHFIYNKKKLFDNQTLKECGITNENHLINVTLDDVFTVNIYAQQKNLSLNQKVTKYYKIQEIKEMYKNQSGVYAEINDIQFYKQNTSLDNNKTLSQCGIIDDKHLITVKFEADGGGNYQD